MYLVVKGQGPDDLSCMFWPWLKNTFTNYDEMTLNVCNDKDGMRDGTALLHLAIIHYIQYLLQTDICTESNMNNTRLHFLNLFANNW